MKVEVSRRPQAELTSPAAVLDDEVLGTGMLTRAFRAYGQLCASKPWEVIIGTLTLTVCTMSMSLFAENSKICGWNYRCELPTEDDTKSSDIIILTLTRCLAVIYVYLQFSNLRRLGSKYLLGIAGLFTVFSSFVFSIGVINIFGSDLTGLNEALPFFLLLVDLSKACTLAKFALTARSQDEVVENIGRGMALLGPMLTLDAIVETLVIAVGTLSGVKILETMCCFGCLSVVANYLAFMTFYPACLALVLELSRGTRPLIHIQQLARVWQVTEEDEKPNPVTQRVKIIMSAGLVVVHAHSRFMVSDGGNANGATSMALNTIAEMSHENRAVVPDIPLWQFYVQKMASLSIDYILTLALATILAIKYIAFDCDAVIPSSAPSASSTAIDTSSTPLTSSGIYSTSELPSFPPNSLSSPSEVVDYGSSSYHSCVVSGDAESTKDQECDEELVHPTEDSSNVSMVSAETQTERPRTKSAVFTVGDSTDESDDSDVESSATVLGRAEMVSDETQTEEEMDSHQRTNIAVYRPPRPVQECLVILKSEDGAAQLNDEEIIALVNSRHIAAYQLESVLDNHLRAVGVRRRLIAESLPSETALENLPYMNYDYKYVHGSCCENVIGHVPIPVGYVKPLLLDGKRYTVPMATTEGCLVASTNRGCRALELSGGIASVLTKDGMTRAPVVRFECAKRADEARRWLDDEANYRAVAEAFNSTSRFARLVSINTKQVAHTLHMRFTSFTGDAMGMNMVSKGCEKALNVMKEQFPDMKILSLSGNFCTDKKPSAVNWVEGRGKSVVCDAVVPARIIRDVLKTSSAALVDLNIAKNLTGSAIAGSIGGFNAHAANVVTAIFIATGQDPAQNVCSSNCITLMETTGLNDDDLYVSCTMPSIEVGTIGGGTILPPQSACLEMLGIRGSNPEEPGANAGRLARIICATVMAAELSLMSALTTGDLVKSHLKHNRSVLNMAPTPSVFYAETSSQSSLPSSLVTNIGSCLKS